MSLSRLVSKCGLKPITKVVDATIKDKDPQMLSNEYRKNLVAIAPGDLVRVHLQRVYGTLIS